MAPLLIPVALTILAALAPAELVRRSACGLATFIFPAPIDPRSFCREIDAEPVTQPS